MWLMLATGVTLMTQPCLICTYRHYKRDFSQLTVAIVGDVLHFPVARSNIHALSTLGVPEIRQ